MDQNEASVVRNMALLRTLSSFIELLAAFAIVRLGSVKGALRINALLGLAGPLFLVTVTLVGISGLAGEIKPARLVLVLAGVLLVLLGTR